MRIEKSTIKSSISKTLLIILGVIIALMMIINSPLFSAELMAPEDERETLSVSEPHLNPEEASLGGANFNSGTRLLHVFTKNLPYLNHK